MEEKLRGCGGKGVRRSSEICALLAFVNSPPYVPETQGFPGHFWIKIDFPIKNPS